MSSTTTRPRRSHLRPADVLRLAGTGLRARPMRAFLSALGIAIGIAAMIAVVGVSTSSRAQLTAQLESLGTNMLTLTPGSDLTGAEVKFPTDAVGRVDKIDGVRQSSSTSLVKASVYRSSLSDKAATGGISALNQIGRASCRERV